MKQKLLHDAEVDALKRDLVKCELTNEELEGRNEAIPVMPFHELAEVVGDAVKSGQGRHRRAG